MLMTGRHVRQQLRRRKMAGPLLLKQFLLQLPLLLMILLLLKLLLILLLAGRIGMPVAQLKCLPLPSIIASASTPSSR